MNIEEIQAACEAAGKRIEEAKARIWAEAEEMEKRFQANGCGPDSLSIRTHETLRQIGEGVAEQARLSSQIAQQTNDAAVQAATTHMMMHGF